ncbi:Fic family protein [Methanoregula sp.]|uniref:Fic family protein n=1 Tax=Methanoregula sp. TaxID=2052170 RepID=UPI003C7099AE
MDDLTIDDIIGIHSRLIAQVGGDARVLSEAGLHQIVFHVNLSADVFHKAAFVLFSFSAYPPFREGNVQTALCIIKKILDAEDYRIEFGDKELADLVKGVESFSLDIEDLEDQIRKYAQKTTGL